MKAIDLTFTYKQFDYQQVYRQNLWCIYRQTKNNTKIERFEVVKLKKLPVQTFPNGKVYPEREGYPSSNEWGVNGWTCWDLKIAQQRLQKQVSLEKNYE